MLERIVAASFLAAGIFCAAPVISKTALAANLAPEAIQKIDLKDLLRLARSGDVRAQRMMGDRFERGNGVDQNYRTAVRWYTAAAKRGDVISQRNLGYLFETGLAGERNYGEAEKWYRLAAGQGDPEAQRSLAHLYAQGLTGEIRKAEAAKWRDRAAGRTTFEPADEISRMRREIVTAVAPRAPVPEARAITASAIAESLDGRPGSQTRIDRPVDVGFAFNRNHPAAARGDLHAQYRLGMIYLTGRGVPRDIERARQWLHTSAEGGYARAQAALGAMYANGIGAMRNVVLAYFWFKLAEERLPPGRTQTMAVTYRQNAEQVMTAEQKLEAQQLAHEWQAEVVPAMAR